MSTLNPRQFERLIEQTRRGMDRRLTELVEIYKVAHDAALERVVRENAGKVTSGGPADPTATITGDPLDAVRPGAQAAIRRVLESAPKDLASAENTIGGISRKIERAMDRLDPREGFEALRYPISVSNADLEESRAAQERRLKGTGMG